MPRLIYSLLWTLALPLVGLRLLWRARRQPDYLRHLGERFGAAPRPRRPRLWLHAVSVGETRAAQPIIKALLAHYPDHELLLTHMTPTGRDTAHELFGKEPRVTSCYLPYDQPWAVARFLRRARPTLGIVMETEVWPNLLRACVRQQIPTVLANARLSERSARGYQRLGSLAQAAFGDFSKVLAQTEDDAKRLKECGARTVEVYGNVKYDVDIAEDRLQLGERFRAPVGARPVIVASNTREGEEAPLLSAFAKHAPANALLVLVPRHPQRFDEVAALVAQQQLALTRRSAALPDEHTRVWLGDSMGEMVAYYRMADVAIVGGSWAPLGGHNLIEACAVGAPVLIGPHTFNFSEATEKALAAGAAERCADLDAALARASQLLADPARSNAMGEAGKHFAAANKGATVRTLQAIAQLLPAG